MFGKIDEDEDEDEDAAAVLATAMDAAADDGAGTSSPPYE